MDNQNYNLDYKPSYDPQPQYQQTSGSRTKSIVAMVLSAASETLGCIHLFGSIPGIGLGIAGLVMGLKERRKNIPQTRGFLVGAKAAGIGGIIFCSIMTLLYAIILSEL